jgi:hypothetical protein
MGDRWWVLSDILAVVMLSVAVYCVGRLALSFGPHRSTQRQSDAIHAVMGVSMAGMLMPSLSAVPTGPWILVFSASTLWFGMRVVRDADRADAGSHAIARHLPHLLMSVAMVYVLIVAEWNGSTSSSHGAAMVMGGTAGLGSARWPVLTVALAVLLLGDGALTFGRDLRRLAPVGAAQVAMTPVATAQVSMATAAGSGAARANPSGRLGFPSGAAPTLAPRSVMVCQLVMSLAMGYMLLSLL